MEQPRYTEIYSKPIELAVRLTEKIEDINKFIESLEVAMVSLEKSLRDLETSVDIPSNEKEERIKGLRKTIEAVNQRIAEKISRRSKHDEQVHRLEKVHDIGMRLLDTIDPSRDTEQ